MLTATDVRISKTAKI